MIHLKNLTERVGCPFDPVHVVERRRFQQHLVKCIRNLPKNHDFVQCQYWHLHYVRRSELNDHLESCEHKLAKEANKKTWEGDKQTKFFQPKLKYNEILPSTELSESWDDATLTAPSFSSEIMSAKANYMTVPQGLSKAKRKDFREKERERLREREEKERVFVAKGEKIQQVQKETIIPVPPRKPTENPVKRLSRIAANFQVPKEHVEESKGLSSPARSSRNGSAGSTPAIGRGRGLLGWSHISEPDRTFRFSPEEFPNL
ncbi:protein D7-like [Daphnia pulicaria]|uniref:protein D7-like n=1 Tax=Daphnia pulicaria TaxID=35523 RepID=UPI001EEC5E65|nr:protein D7-like [Daphnia pulicaria]XP_046639252.1 protein D7-like [Daphnia pulicaria]XP_046639253.1 protein D7-like [Daphnia pulicaria]